MCLESRFPETAKKFDTSSLKGVHNNPIVRLVKTFFEFEQRKGAVAMLPGPATSTPPAILARE